MGLGQQGPGLFFRNHQAALEDLEILIWESEEIQSPWGPARIPEPKEKRNFLRTVLSETAIFRPDM